MIRERARVLDCRHRGQRFTSYVDSGAAQTIFSVSEAYIPSSLRQCSIEIEGFAGSSLVTRVGTIRLLLWDTEGTPFIGLFHDSLVSEGAHNLVSVSQVHARGHRFDLRPPSPHLCLDPYGESRHVSITVQEGMYELPFQILSVGDARLQYLPVIDVSGVVPSASACRPRRSRWRPLPWCMLGLQCPCGGSPLRPRASSIISPLPTTASLGFGQLRMSWFMVPPLRIPAW